MDARFRLFLRSLKKHNRCGVEGACVARGGERVQAPRRVHVLVGGVAVAVVDGHILTLDLACSRARVRACVRACACGAWVG
jgi:hypothetical protein